MDDPHNLSRFVRAQEEVYRQALSELRRGRKRTHWMWYVFPQLEGLGCSLTSREFAIKSLEEARAYLEHPVLGPRLIECTETILGLEHRSPEEIFGFPDDLKLRSSVTLFRHVSQPGSVFDRVLEQYFGGEPDAETLRLLKIKTSEQAP